MNNCFHRLNYLACKRSMKFISFWNETHLELWNRYIRDGTLDFWGRGRLGQITFFFPLGGKSLFLGADRGEEGDREWVRMLVVPFRGQRNQRLSWYVLRCFSLNKIPEISITRTNLMVWLEPLEHIDQGIFIFGFFNFLLLSWHFLGVDINCCHSHTDKTQVPFIIL